MSTINGGVRLLVISMAVVLLAIVATTPHNFLSLFVRPRGDDDGFGLHGKNYDNNTNSTHNQGVWRARAVPPCPSPNATHDMMVAVGDEIGSGQQGTVSEAYIVLQEGETPTHAALKYLRGKENEREGDARKRSASFRAEMNALCLIHNNSVAEDNNDDDDAPPFPRFLARRDDRDCTLWDENGRPSCFLAMEHLEGETLLARVLRNRGMPLPIEEAMEAVIGAARGLSYLRERNLAYRHVQPENVILSKRRGVVLVDLTWVARYERQTDDDDKSPLPINSATTRVPPSLSLDDNVNDVRHPVPSTRCSTACRLSQGVAPEWIRESTSPMAVDPFAADVYTLGLLLYFVAVSPVGTYAWWSERVRSHSSKTDVDIGDELALPDPDGVLFRGARPTLTVERVLRAHPEMDANRARLLMDLIADAWSHDPKARPNFDQFVERANNIQT